MPKMSSSPAMGVLVSTSVSPGDGKYSGVERCPERGIGERRRGETVGKRCVGCHSYGVDGEGDGVHLGVNKLIGMGGTRVLPIEVFYQIFCVDIIGRFPTVMCF